MRGSTVLICTSGVNGLSVVEEVAHPGRIRVLVCTSGVKRLSVVEEVAHTGGIGVLVCTSGTGVKGVA